MIRSKSNLKYLITKVDQGDTKARAVFYLAQCFARVEDMPKNEGKDIYNNTDMCNCGYCSYPIDNSHILAAERVINNLGVYK